MKIKSLMVPGPITVPPKAKVEEAIELMKINAIRHLPVVNKSNRLLGLVTLADLKQALIPSMLGEVSLAEFMIKNPFTVAPDDDIELAAQLIYKHKIGGLPVTRGSRLVGIITETDILRAFIDMMGIIGNSARIDIITGDAPADLNRAIQIIHDQGGDIINVGMTAQQSAQRTYYFRLAPVDIHAIKRALEIGGFEVQTVMQ